MLAHRKHLGNVLLLNRMLRRVTEKGALHQNSVSRWLSFQTFEDHFRDLKVRVTLLSGFPGTGILEGCAGVIIWFGK